MRRRFFVFFPLGFSVLLHLVVIFSCSLRINAKGNPLLCSWPNIVNRKDLFLEKKEIIFPRGISFSSHNLRKKYFFSSRFFRLYSSKGEERDNLGLFLPEFKQTSFAGNFKTKENYFYFWERENTFSSGDGEAILFKAYVSPHGKVLFLYPEKLPVNSYGNLHLQEYLWGAAIFLNNKFFWTKLEGVVK